MQGTPTIRGIAETQERRASGAAFSTFSVFYMLSFFIDLSEDLATPVLAICSAIAFLFVYLRGVTRWNFFVFLLLSTTYLLAFRIPDAGNHNNLYVLYSLFLMIVIAYASRGVPAKNDDDLFDILQPPLRVSFALTYFFAGFHKLNTDFFHPEAGCSIEFFSAMWNTLLLPDVAFAPVTALAAAVFALTWELGGGLMLWLRRLQPAVLFVCWIMHSILAQMVFFDFSALAFALMLTFIPSSYWQLLERRSLFRLGSFQVRRVDFYVYANVLVFGAALLYLWSTGDNQRIPRLHRLQGLALDVGFLAFIWPILSQLFQGTSRMRWLGVPMWTRAVPAGLVLLPAFVVFFGMNPYLGLRTAGTFSMFSNLRTEGATSNHLFLGANPLKIWGYQEDVVAILDIDPRHAEGPRDELTGYLLPVVEFKKRIYDWQKRGLRGLSATFEYRNRVVDTRDVVLDNPWNTRARDMEMYLLDFRVIQKSGPNRCRW